MAVVLCISNSVSNRLSFMAARLYILLKVSILQNKARAGQEDELERMYTAVFFELCE